MMDKNLLKEILLEQKEVLQEKERGIDREYLAKIEKYTKIPHIVVISGIRRCGKSTLLLQTMQSFYKEPIYYCNFEDERLVDFTAKDFNSLYELCIELFGESKIFFFDEIQNIKGWEIFVRRLYESGFKMYVTGSNASLLSKEIGTRLTGRYIPVELYPFSFREYLVYEGVAVDEKSLLITSKRAEIKKQFNRYLENGGIPEYLKYREKDILTALYHDIIYRDIVARHEIKEIKALRDLSVYLLSNAGALSSYNRLKNMLGVGSVNTVKSYMEYLENTFLISTIPLFAYSVRRQVVNPRKAYAVDNGMMRMVSIHFSENKGKFLENLVLVELKRRRKEIYYYKTNSGLEVDFVIKEGTKARKLIQVTQSLSRKQVRHREIDSLLASMKELKIKEGLILTEGDEEDIVLDKKKIKVLPIYKWLLETA